MTLSKRITSIIIALAVTLSVLFFEPNIASAANNTTLSRAHGVASKAASALTWTRPLPQVKQPTLSATGVATWPIVPNAKNYEIQLYRDDSEQGTPLTVTSGETSYNFLFTMRAAGSGSYTVKVTAKGNGRSYADGPESEPSNAKEVKALTQITQPTWTENTLSWVADVNSTNYEVKLFKDGHLLSTQTLPSGTTSFDFETILSENLPGTFSATVQAKGSVLFLDGAVSVPSLNTTGHTALAQVEQPILSVSGAATWADVENAANYLVQLFRNDSPLGAPQSVTSGETGCNFLSTMRAAGEGRYTVKVTAKGNSNFYTDGPQSKPSFVQVVRALTQVTQLTWTANTLSWAADRNATNYEVKLFCGDTLISTKIVPSNITSFDFGNIITQNTPGILTATVQTKGMGLYLDGEVSTTSNKNVQSVILDQVGKPTLSALGVATWPNVANATNYKVQLCLNGSALGAPQTATNGDKGYNFLPVMRATGSGSYTVKVTAVGDDLLYLQGLPSIASNEQVISKAISVTMINLSSSGIATWTTTNGTCYDLKLYKDGVVVDTQIQASAGYNYLSAMRSYGAGKYTVTVTVKSDTGLIVDGDESAPSAAQTVTALAQPAQPVWTSDIITWYADANATNYEIKLYKGGSLIDTQTLPVGTNSFDYSSIISQNVPGDFTVTVQSKGSGLFINSGVSLFSISNLKTVKLSTVSKPTLSAAGIATWTNTANSTNCQVQLYCNSSALGAPQYVNSGETGYDFSSAIKANGSGNYTVKVVANGAGMYYSSDISEASNTQVAGPMATFNGIAENIFEPVTKVVTGSNSIVVTKVEPNITLSAGVETTLIVEVEYNLVTADSATLSINSNVGGYTMTSANEIEVSKLKVSKGCGKLRFTLSIIPKLWDNGASFFILSKLYQNGNYYCSSPKVNLSVQ